MSSDSTTMIELSSKELFGMANKSIQALGAPELHSRLDDGSSFYVCAFSGKPILPQQEVFSLRPLRHLSEKKSVQTLSTLPVYGTFAGPVAALRALERILARITGVTHSICEDSNLNLGMNYVLQLRGELDPREEANRISLQQICSMSDEKLRAWINKQSRSVVLAAQLGTSIATAKAERASHARPAVERAPKPKGPCVNCGLPWNVQEIGVEIRTKPIKVPKKAVAKQAQPPADEARDRVVKKVSKRKQAAAAKMAADLSVSKGEVFEIGA